MDLAAKSSALLRSKLVMRLSCVLVAVGFLVSSVVTPRAQAVAGVDDAVVGSMALASYLSATGLELSVIEGGAATVTAGLGAVAGEYAAATGAAASGEAVLGSIAAGTAISTAGTIILTAAAVAACAGLAYWLYNTYLVDREDSVIVYSDSSNLLIGGVPFRFCDIYGSTEPGTPLSPSSFDSFSFPNGTVLSFELSGNNICFLITSPSGKQYSFLVNCTGVDSFYYVLGCSYLDGLPNPNSPVICYRFINGTTPSSSSSWLSDLYVRDFFDVSASVSDLAISVEEYYSIPEIQPNQSMEITIPSAAPGSTLAELAETVPQQVADGTLSATYTIDTAAPTPPSISDGDVEDVDELGLPSLGEALTRRFPFSIPWDIARGITLLAAPAKTPYFEVDFYAPISDLVGGWQGSTKLVLDFSQFESLGRLSRWTSTIGFCLFLASATKRFIWTA